MSHRDVATLLEARANKNPARPFLKMEGVTLSYGEFNERCNRVATGFSSYGVKPGDMVCVMLPNCEEFMLSWFALLKLGAVTAPINTAFRGSVLSHVLELTKSPILVVDDSYLDFLEEISDQLRTIRLLFVKGDDSAAARRFGQWDVQPFEALNSRDAGNPQRLTQVGDLAMLLFTSGTTGPSKACMLSHRYLLRNAELMIENFDFRPDDVLYCPFPLFHADASVFTVLPALLLSSQAAIAKRFSASRFWDEIRDFGATIFDYMGASLTILWKQDPSPNDVNNPVRLAWGVPMPEFWKQFQERFDLRLVEIYGLTDGGVPIYDAIDRLHITGSCGRAIPQFDVRIFDDGGFEVPHGSIGEIVIRPLEPSLIMDGYYRMPEATLGVFRDLWLHTGDLGYRDEEGQFYFVGRQKDAIRRRGENMSAFEIEQVVENHPDVMEVAAIGVPSELTEEDVKICVVLRPEATADPERLIEYCVSRMAKFMVPRYVEFMNALPRTPTGKVEKYKLRESGVTARTWDQAKDEEAKR